MPRTTPPGRVQNVARAACEVFIEKGYRRTRLTDVAERLELSHALLYRYVESKEALLELATRYAIGQEHELDALVPLATPADDGVLELIRGHLAARAGFAELGAALEQGPSGDGPRELGAIIDELYGFIEQNQMLLLLIESLADDYPGLAGDSVNERKRGHNDRLAAFLSSRVEAGELGPISDPQIAAHFLAESIAWFAQHRKRDPAVAAINDQQARASVRELLLAALGPERRSR